MQGNVKYFSRFEETDALHRLHMNCMYWHVINKLLVKFILSTHLRLSSTYNTFSNGIIFYSALTSSCVFECLVIKPYLFHFFNIKTQNCHKKLPSCIFVSCMGWQSIKNKFSFVPQMVPTSRLAHGLLRY